MRAKSHLGWDIRRLVAVIVLLAPSSAFARDVTYRVPSECPSRATFERDLRTLASGSAALREVSVERRAGACKVGRCSSPEHYVATVVLDGPRGAPVGRSLTGARCDEVLRAAALVASLGSPAADGLEDAPRRSSVLSEPPKDGVGAESDSGREAESHATPSSSFEDGDSVRVPSGPAARTVAPLGGVPSGYVGGEVPIGFDPTLERWRPSVHLAPTITVPSTSVGGYLGFELAHDHARHLSPLFRVGVEVAAGTLERAGADPTQPYLFGRPGPSLVTRSYLGRFEVCPLRAVAAALWSADALSAGLCARVDAGVRNVWERQGDGAEGSKVARPWLSAGTTGELRWALPRVYFGAQAGVMAPLVRDTYALTDGSRSRVGAVAFVSGVMFGVYLDR